MRMSPRKVSYCRHLLPLWLALREHFYNKMDFNSDLLTRSALGRTGFIGEFYDARTERFTSMSLLKTSFPKNLIQRQDIGKMEYDYKFTETVSDRFELLKVEAELQLSILSGLVEVGGSGLFLNEEKKTQKTVSCSLVCNLQTVCEKLFAVSEEAVQYFNLSALENPHHTHVVVEISWGASCLLTLEAAFGSESEKKQMEGCLKGQLSGFKGLLSVETGGKLAQENRRNGKMNDFKIKVVADVVPSDGWPTSVEGFSKFVDKIPHLVKKLNEGKGKPLRYVLMPVSTIRKVAKLNSEMNAVVQTIEQSFIMTVVFLFQDISEVKSELSDIVAEMKKLKKFAGKELEVATKELEKLRVTESELKSIITENWVAVRSGEKTLSNLFKLVESFRRRSLNLHLFEDYIRSCDPIMRKLSEVQKNMADGIICLGKGEKFVDVQARDLSAKYVVLITSSELQANDPDLSNSVYCYFLTLAKERRENTKYVAIDLDFELELPRENGSPIFFKIAVENTRCFHVLGTSLLSADLYADYLFEKNSNFVRLKANSKVEYIEHKPGNRVLLKMTCPNFELGYCRPDKVNWHCIKCKCYIEYGFDNLFYCSCGKGQAIDFEYRCSGSEHGNSFTPAAGDFLKKMLSSLRPFEEMNILVLGSTGVGKSTWINSIVNYLSYDSMQSAREGGVIATIPSAFTIYEPGTSKKHEIRVGADSLNEVRVIGDSATQYPHTYSLLWGGKNIRIIDTPGLCDTRGISKDKENLKNIIDHIGHLKEVHGVCILMRAGINKLDPTFSYCITELLVHLHRDVAKNIVFCFTNARTSIYSAGESSVILEKLTEKLGIEEKLRLGIHNMFSLDNEAFRFLCTISQTDIEYDKDIIESLSKSWDVSAAETKRLFETIKSFEPHLLKETLTLVTARNRILSLTKPIAEVSRTIQLNLASLETVENKIKNSDMTLEQLHKDLMITHIHLEPVPLKLPRTVCTSAHCVVYHEYEHLDVREIEYVKHCHTECYLTQVEPKTVNNAQLKNCDAMSAGVCTVCGCGWQNHMHLTYSQKRVEKPAIRLSVKNAIEKETEDKEREEQTMENLKKEIDKYKEELEVIIQTSVKFGMFLKKNAITVYNDSVQAYLEYLINEEEKKPIKTDAEINLIKSMKSTLEHYLAEVQVLQEVVTKGGTEVEELTPQNVEELEQRLYLLELSGADIRKNVELSRSSKTQTYMYAETPLRINSNKKATENTKEKSWSKKIINWYRKV